ncbi:hypothetical protein K461DRAFT_294285 [Myriangium duriaei CBS 260.36]|uniref:Uncharacterized protein n=1 Tax=Myriangium duriaei CBS 260.36 TaxID=1168546 RepID=A0A9P4IZA2_9PEZI|nr:hypothetical protein K461DRAFT_294285 [Myriangium duriaei CBS 260.36]
MDDSSEEKVMFRPSKRRKVFRTRATDDEEEGVFEAKKENPDTTKSGDEDDLKGFGRPKAHLRNPFRKSGIAFSSGDRPNRDSSNGDVNATALVPSNPAISAAAMAASRFVVPTGQLAVKEDKHMTAYIDSRLTSATRATAPSSPQHTTQPEAPLKSSPNQNTQVTPQSSASDQPSNPKHPSRPVHHRPRRPPVRTTADDARDALVDQLLSTTHRVESPYSAATVSTFTTSTTVRGHNPDADARMAAEFEREFRLGAEERRARSLAAAAANNAAPVGAAGKAAASSSSSAVVDKGPKMGGSKNRKR